MTSPTIINPAALPSLPLDEHRGLPNTAAIYFVLAGDTVLYIGQSSSLRQRWLAHHRLQQLNEYGACRIAWMTVEDAGLLDELERACIAHFEPVLNGQKLPKQERPGVAWLTWKAAVTMPPEAGKHLERIAQEMGVQPAVAIRILLLEKLRERAAQEGHIRTSYDWSGGSDVPTSASKTAPGDDAISSSAPPRVPATAAVSAPTDTTGA